jgi:hypothetical protein
MHGHAWRRLGLVCTVHVRLLYNKLYNMLRYLGLVCHSSIDSILRR